MMFISFIIVINFSINCDSLKFNTIQPTKEINLQVDECYEISLGFYRNNNYNSSIMKKCPGTNKGCYAQIESKKTNLEVAGCNYNNHICGDSAFVVKYNYSLTYTCCELNLCNSKEFINNKLKYKCEFGKRLLKSMKLTYKVKNTKLPSVKKCYYCNECNSFKDAKIINCTVENKTNKKFACRVIYSSKLKFIILTVMLYYIYFSIFTELIQKLNLLSIMEIVYQLKI